jgi:hypothetical protein
VLRSLPHFFFFFFWLFWLEPGLEELELEELFWLFWLELGDDFSWRLEELF